MADQIRYEEEIMSLADSRHKEEVKSNLEEKFKAAIDDMNMTSDLDYNDIEKKDTHNVSEGVVETGINENYSWDEDDNGLFLSISIQEILDQNNFSSTSKRGHKFPANKAIIQVLQFPFPFPSQYCPDVDSNRQSEKF
uniref:Uncharacterized protein n=1 Tax=Glossina morsitans morsitans TaxID=37546 RepID=A0A1B0FK44_GLOMM